MNQYIITEEQIELLHNFVIDKELIWSKVRSRPVDDVIPIEKVYEWLHDISLVGNLSNIYGEPPEKTLKNGCFIEPWKLEKLMREYLRHNGGGDD